MWMVKKFLNMTSKLNFLLCLLPNTPTTFPKHFSPSFMHHYSSNSLPVQKLIPHSECLSSTQFFSIQYIRKSCPLHLQNIYHISLLLTIFMLIYSNHGQFIRWQICFSFYSSLLQPILKQQKIC